MRHSYAKAVERLIEQDLTPPTRKEYEADPERFWAVINAEELHRSV